MSCFENITMPSCIWFENREKRNTIASIAAGILFFTGWWLIIDSASVYPHELPNVVYVCGVTATLSLIMVNSVSNAQVSGETYTGGCMGPRGSRLWLFIGFVVGFFSLIASCAGLFANSPGKHTWSGVSLFLQNAFILAASMVFKFCRTEEHWG